MQRRNDQTFGAAAILGWAGVGAYGIWEMAGQQTADGRQRPYLLFTVSLLVAMGGTAAVAWAAAGRAERRGLRNAGAGVATLTVASSLVAWAVPLWATLLVVTCAVFAVAPPRAHRSVLVVLAAAPVVGMAVMIVAIAAELGRQDSYGDYPAAFGLGTTTIAAGCVAGLMMLARQRRAAPPVSVTAADRSPAALV